MRLSGIHHVSILVTDMARSIDFYSRVLGLTEAMRPSNFTVAVRWFQLGEHQIHLIPSTEADAISPRHFALHVDDSDAARAYFRGRGMEIRETDPIAGADRFFVADPDGNNIEIIHWFRPWDERSEAELGIPEQHGRQLAQQTVGGLPGIPSTR